jgi:hypothetical protein
MKPSSLLAAALMFPLSAGAANLEKETVKAWDDYIRTVEAQVRGGNQRCAFLWTDERPDRAAKVHGGEIVVAAAKTNSPKEVPSGLIHDWIGAVFIPNATISQALPVIRDYGRYKDFYRPAVVDSRPIALSDSEDRFSILLANRFAFRNTALDSDYKSAHFRVDGRRMYTISQTTRIQEVAEYGNVKQHVLPEDQGTGLIWRLFSVTRFEERDGGVYVEIEAIALSRDIPVSLRWLVEPIVRRVSKTSLLRSLEETRNAVRSNAMNAAVTVAETR